MKSFVIESFTGISDYEGKGIKGSFKFGSALDVRKKVDSLSCQQALVTEGASVLTQYILWLVPASDGNTYGLSEDGNIYKRTSAGVWTHVYEGSTGRVKGAAEWFSSAGKAYLYWVEYNNKLHRKELPGLSNWTDVDADATWPKTTLASASWHPMKRANGALMIGNEQYIAMVGYDSSFTNQALDLSYGNTVNALVERDDYLVVGTGRKDNSESGELYIWEQNALSWLKKKSIPSKGINAMIDTELTLMQAGTSGGLYFSDLVNTTRLTSFPGGGQVNPDAVVNSDGLALFGVYGNGDGNKGVYSYGRKNKNDPFVLNLDYPIDCTEIGSVKKVGSNILISYYKESSPYNLFYVKRVDTTIKATAVYESLDLKAPPDLPSRPLVWQMVKLLTAPIVSGTSISLKYKVNKTGSWTTAYLQDGTSSYDDVGETEAVFLVGAEGKIFEFQLILTPTGNTSPEVYRAEVFFT